MKSVGVTDTGPEMIVRRMLHRMGYRYRLHDRRFPGRPDLVFPKRHKAIFVHGCFWHGHGCTKGRLPKSRLDYWLPKIEANRARDARNLFDMNALGWAVLVVWQCETRDASGLRETLAGFLEGDKKTDQLLLEERLASTQPREPCEEKRCGR